MNGCFVALSYLSKLFVVVLGVAPLVLLCCLAAGFIVTPLQETGRLYDIGWNSIWRSGTFAAVSACVELSIAVLLLWLLPEKHRSAGRPASPIEFSIAALPVSIPPVALALLWRLLLEAEGPLAALFQQAGLKLPALLSTKSLLTMDGFSNFNWAYVTLLLVDAWMWMPLLVFALLIACRRIPQPVIDAAKVDGASEGQTFWYVQIPLILDWIVWIWLFRFVDVLRAHDVHWVLFKNLADILPMSIDVYNRGVGLRQYADAAQLALVSTLISGLMLIIAWTLYRLRKASFPRRAVRRGASRP
jgi:multiple sugar transport system permease protein